MHGGVTARLVVSLSGLTDTDLQAVDRGAALAADLDARGVPLTHLFRPRGAVDAPASALRDLLRARLAAGDALAVHGFDHTPDPTGARIGVGRRAEFAALPAHEAVLRLRGARRALAACGFAADVFVPPRWIASPGTFDALRDVGMAVCADETGEHVLSGADAGFVRSRVLGFRGVGERRDVAADRRAAEAWRARLLVAEVGRTARRGGPVRIAVRAKDLRRPVRRAAVLAAVDAALALGAVPEVYDARAARRAA